MKAGYFAHKTINKLNAKALIAQIIPLEDAASNFIVTSQYPTPFHFWSKSSPPHMQALMKEVKSRNNNQNIKHIGGMFLHLQCQIKGGINNMKAMKERPANVLPFSSISF
mmetsp:Transcript_5775/g.6931  ORF Transcript_5775/g.6931 Transcript_5775/m.6931 type:complete len:110 (-) Transcript_5775:57-386(-)